MQLQNFGLYLLIKTKSDGSIRIATDFKYLGPWIDGSGNMKTRKAQAWVASNKLGKIWKSNLCMGKGG